MRTSFLDPSREPPAYGLDHGDAHSLTFSLFRVSIIGIKASRTGLDFFPFGCRLPSFRSGRVAMKNQNQQSR
jgi:hypothetical protein